MSGVLNALDGVGAQQGRLFFATTNCYDVLDPALVRSGRMDVHVEFKHASSGQIEELFRVFYMPDGNSQHVGSGGDDEKPFLFADGRRGYTGVEVRKLASQFSSTVPGHRLSMARIQGFLLDYKDDPQGAVDKAYTLAIE